MSALFQNTEPSELGIWPVTLLPTSPQPHVVSAWGCTELEIHALSAPFSLINLWSSHRCSPLITSVSFKSIPAHGRKIWWFPFQDSFILSKSPNSVGLSERWTLHLAASSEHWQGHCARVIRSKWGPVPGSVSVVFFLFSKRKKIIAFSLSCRLRVWAVHWVCFACLSHILMYYEGWSWYSSGIIQESWAYVQCSTVKQCNSVMFFCIDI